MTRIDTLGNFLTDVAKSIKDKKGDQTPIKASDFDTEITNLPTGGGDDISEYFNINPTSEELATTNGWVKNNYIKKCADIIIPDTINNISGLCSSFLLAPKIICNNNITNVSSLYSSNTSTSIDVSGLDTSNVTNMKDMFYNCQSLINIDVSNLDTSNVTNIREMFSNCQNIKEIDISNLDFSKVQSTTSNNYRLFYGCYKLEKVIMPSKINVSLYQYFSSCYSLKTLILLRDDAICQYSSTLTNCFHMDGTVNANYNPDGLKDGRIYVPDNLVNSYKSASGWVKYADIILPLSELE